MGLEGVSGGPQPAAQERPVEVSVQQKIAESFISRITEATTPEELLAAFDRAVIAGEMMSVEATYMHPEGGSSDIADLRKYAAGYIAAAQRGNTTEMYELSDMGLPPEFKSKVNELFPYPAPGSNAEA